MIRSTSMNYSPPFAREEIYSGTTNGSGDWTVTFPVAFTTAPNVQPVLYPTNNAAMLMRLTSVSTTGFTLRIEQRASLTVLGIDLLSFAVTPVNNASVRAFVAGN